jgi:hypothetical protein
LLGAGTALPSGAADSGEFASRFFRPLSLFVFWKLLIADF